MPSWPIFSRTILTRSARPGALTWACKSVIAVPFDLFFTGATRAARLRPPVRARVEIRMKRQRFLIERGDPPELYFLIDEAAIRRLLGDEETRRGQLDYLISTAKQPGVTIEIVPFSIGLHSGMDENFTILEFGDPNDDDILYFESAREAIFSQNDADEIRIHRDLFEHVRNISLGPEQSLEYLIQASRILG